MNGRGSIKGKGNVFFPKHWEEIIGYMKIDLCSNIKVGLGKEQERKKLFLAIDKKTRKSFVEYYLYKTREIFLFKNIDEKIISRALKIALKRVSYHYYFQEAKAIAFKIFSEDPSKGIQEISDQIYDLIGPELSEEDRFYAIEYSIQKFQSDRKYGRL